MLLRPEDHTPEVSMALASLGFGHPCCLLKNREARTGELLQRALQYVELRMRTSVDEPRSLHLSEKFGLFVFNQH